MKTYVEWYLESCNRSINKEFLEWISKVENKVLLLYGMTLLDLPDEDYMENFKLNIRPEIMADIIFENNKF